MHKLAALCVRRPVFATMLILSLVVAGSFALLGMGIELYPNIDFPVITVTIVEEGATSEQIEADITVPVEAAVNSISGIESLRSVSANGVSQIYINFDLDKNIDTAVAEIRGNLDRIQDDLPASAQKAVVSKINTTASPVLRILVSGPFSLEQLTELAHSDVQSQLENVSGVGQIQAIGEAPLDLKLWVDPEKASAYGLTLPEVYSAVREQTATLPIGAINEGSSVLNVSSRAALSTPEEFGSLLLHRPDNSSVRFSDIATAAYARRSSGSIAMLNDTPGVALVVYKQSGKNLTAVAKAVRERLDEIRPGLPRNLSVQIVSDNSTEVEASVDDMRTHLVEGSLCACVVIFLFLSSFSLTFISALAIPCSLIATFAAMRALGYSLNLVTLLALTLMVGIVIDDAIVVLENIARFVEHKGMSPAEAVLRGTQEISLAVLATTMSLLAVFLPVGFMGGIVGRFLAQFGITCAVAIAVSLLVSFTLTPMLTARFFGSRRQHSTNHNGSVSGAYRRLEIAYARLLRWSLRHRWVIVCLSVLVIVSIVPLLSLAGASFTPDEDTGDFEVTLNAAQGASLAQSALLMQRVARSVRTLPAVTETVLTIGEDQGSSNAGSIYVKLAPQKERAGQLAIMQQARALLAGTAPNLNPSVNTISDISGGGQRDVDIEFVLTGPDLATLEGYARQLKQKMSSIPDLMDVDTSALPGQSELNVQLDAAKAASAGIQASALQQTLHLLVQGEEIGHYSQGGQQRRIWLQAAPNWRTNRDSLGRASLRTGTGSLIPISSVAHLQGAAVSPVIDRYNRQRSVAMYANVRPGKTQTEALSRIDEAVASLHMASGYTRQLVGSSRELEKTIYYFAIAFGLTLAFMYIVLAAQFESFLHPLTILLTLPLAVPFGLLAVVLCHQSLNLFSGLGLLVLFGIVKKNAILQIDHTIGLRHAGLARNNAIIRANRDRLRPILMTTLAFVAGAMPLLLSHGPSAQANRSIGVLIVGGQSLCLLLTLLAVPVFYCLLDDLQNLMSGRRLAADRRRVSKRARAVRASVALCVLACATRVRAQSVQLTVHDAILLAMRNDPEVHISALDRQLAEDHLRAASAFAVPNLTGDGYISREITPQSSILAPGFQGRLAERYYSGQISLDGVLPAFGTQYQGLYLAQRISTNDQFASLDPNYPTQLQLTLRQPLLRGRRFDAARHELAVAREKAAAATLDQQEVALKTAAVVEDAFWALYAAQEDVQSSQTSLDEAQAQLKSTERQIAARTLAESDRFSSAAGVEQARIALLQAQSLATRASNALKRLLAVGTDDPVWDEQLDVTHQARPVSLLPIADAVREAQSRNLGLAQERSAQRMQDFDTRLAADNTKPQLDLSITYRANGLAGGVTAAAQETFAGFTNAPPQALVGGPGRSNAQLFEHNYPSIRAELRLALPLSARRAQAELDGEKQQSRKVTEQKRTFELELNEQVRDAQAAVIAAQAEYEASQVALDDAQAQYQSEQRRYLQGLSSLFLLQDRLATLSLIRQRTNASRAALFQESARYDATLGRLLEVDDIHLEAARQPTGAEAMPGAHP